MAYEVFGERNIEHLCQDTYKKRIVPKEEQGLDTATDKAKKTEFMA